MRDAVSMSIDWVKDKGKRDKKVLLVVTDGDDNTSQITLEKLVQKSQQTEVLVYAIGILADEERREAKRAQRALEALTRASGGSAAFPKDLTEVETIASDVAHNIRNQYILAYTPSNTALDGSYRQIRVTANGPNRPVVRTRTGYYATADPAEKKTSSSACTRTA
jgi:VWFA-related protein